jgi:hypothetical protein
VPHQRVDHGQPQPPRRRPVGPRVERHVGGGAQHGVGRPVPQRHHPVPSGGADGRVERGECADRGGRHPVDERREVGQHGDARPPRRGVVRQHEETAVAHGDLHRAVLGATQREVRGAHVPGAVFEHERGDDPPQHGVGEHCGDGAGRDGREPGGVLFRSHASAHQPATSAPVTVASEIQPSSVGAPARTA